MSEDNVKTLRLNDISTHAIVTYLQQSLPNISEMFVVTKDKDGTWNHSMSGDIQGLAVAILILQQYAVSSLHEAPLER